MGVIADMFQRQIDELKRIDEESQRRTNKLLRNLDELIDELKSLDEI